MKSTFNSMMVLQEFSLRNLGLLLRNLLLENKKKIQYSQKSAIMDLIFLGNIFKKSNDFMSGSLKKIFKKFITGDLVVITLKIYFKTS